MYVLCFGKSVEIVTTPYLTGTTGFTIANVMGAGTRGPQVFL